MVGIFIGSFNPPTIAHLEICLKLKKRFTKIVFVPVSSKDKNLVDIRKRIIMLNFYTSRFSFLEIDDIMKNYSYLNYRIIDILKRKYHNIEIIMGSDLLDKLVSFDNYEELLKNYSFTIIPRDNINLNKMIKSSFFKYQDKFYILDYHSNISSTMAKELLSNNLDTTGVLDKGILKFIKENSLY